jgi:hypothetical protein
MLADVQMLARTFGNAYILMTELSMVGIATIYVTAC